MRALRLLDLTLPSPAENLALDEALLDELDEHGNEPVLRFWESDRLFVVLGASCRPVDDVHLAACEQDGVPVLRRARYWVSSSAPCSRTPQPPTRRSASH